MGNIARWRAALCLTVLSTLAACGGGGASAPNEEPIGTPSEKVNQLTVEGGDSAVAARTYVVDTAYDRASSTQILDQDVLEVISPDSDSFDSSFIYAQNNPKKFAVAFIDNTHGTDEIFACRSAEWNATEIKVLNERSKTGSMPLCASDITIDTAARFITFSGLRLTSLSNASRSLNLGGDFSWTLQNKEPVFSVIKIESGSTLGREGTYSITGGETGPSILGPMEFDTTIVRSTLPTVTFYSLPGDLSRYVVVAQVEMGHSRIPAPVYYACVSAAWNEEEIASIGGGSDPGLSYPPARCPDSVTVKNNHLILDKAALPMLDDPAIPTQIVLSLNIAVSSSTTTSGSATTSPNATPIAPPVTPPAPSTGS